MLMDLDAYNPTLIILGQGRFVQFFVVKKCANNPLPCLGCFGIKKKK